MNWIRSKVSGKRRRYKDNSYNLDITYITDNILAMSFPASGMESCYRNKIGEVANFLDTKHPGHYKIINLSNRKYDYGKFKGKVDSYWWEDHHAPEMTVIFEIWYEIYSYVNKSPDNVAVIHCNSGKGRTGTAIACYLLYSGLFTTSDAAIDFYGK